MPEETADLHERVLREPGKYTAKDNTAKAPSELAAQYRRVWLRFYAECAAFQSELRRFHLDVFLPARPYWSDSAVMEREGYEVDFWRFAKTYTLGEVCHTLPSLRTDDYGNPLPHPQLLERYLMGLRDLCSRWGLDRLYSVEIAAKTMRAGTDRELRGAAFASATADGPAEVHSWCEFEMVWGVGEGCFGQTRESAHFRPALGDPELYVLEGPNGERLMLRDATAIPQIEVVLTESWDPREETRAEAEKRILERVSAQVRSRLDEIGERVKQAECEGRVAKHDTEPKLLQHMAWAFMHVALVCPYSEIERAHLAWTGEVVPEDSIKRAVYKLAPRLGLRPKN